MTVKGTRLVAGVIEILLGIFLGSVSMYIYFMSDFSDVEAAGKTLFIIQVIVLPLIGLILIGFGIKNLVVKDKVENME